MGLIYNTNLKASTARSTLIVAPAALALIVLLLWFGSIRNPDPVSADEGRSLWDCPQASLEPCDEPASMNSVDTSIDAASVSSSGHSGEKCLFPGIPCLHDHGLEHQAVQASGTEENGRCIFIGNPCFHSSGHGLSQTIAASDLKGHLRTY